ncbi:MAG: TlpA disulfide reductase family protein [Cytophagales bacterium]|nr:TlpA disulfide reductase family protein [Cytophagales bacterium]
MRLEQLENSGVEFPKRNKMIQESMLGCKAPDFISKTITGELISLTELKGKVVVINFWFTSCAPCITEMPTLNRLVEEFKYKDVVFIAFARDDVMELTSFLKRDLISLLLHLPMKQQNHIVVTYLVGQRVWLLIKVVL